MEKIRALADMPWMFSHFALGPDYCGLTYQACRFCKRGGNNSDLRGLWKYGVRHYICEDCRKAKVEGR